MVVGDLRRDARRASRRSRWRSRAARPARSCSVDSMQVYAGVETLTNQPSAAERAEVPHHLVGYLPLTETSSVGAHAPLAHAAIDAVAERGATPLVVGGTGLYLRAALTDLGAAAAPCRPRERAHWERFYDERGARAALAALAERDPRAAGAPARERPPPRRARARARRAGSEPGARARPAVGRRHAPAGGRRGRDVAARGAARAHRGAHRGDARRRGRRRGARRCARAASSPRRRRRASSGSRRSARTSTAARRWPSARPRSRCAPGSTRAGRRPGRVGSPRPSSSQAPTARSATPTACWS